MLDKLDEEEGTEEDEEAKEKREKEEKDKQEEKEREDEKKGEMKPITEDDVLRYYDQAYESLDKLIAIRY